MKNNKQGLVCNLAMHINSSSSNLFKSFASKSNNSINSKNTIIKNTVVKRIVCSLISLFAVVSFVCLPAQSYMKMNLMGVNSLELSKEASNSAASSLSIKNPIIKQKNVARSVGWVRSVDVVRYVLASIRNARSRLYDDRSIYFEGIPLQDYVSRCGLTKQAYVNNIQYDSANEEDAYRRAQETAQHGKFGHFAPDGKSAPNFDGRKAWGENLSWGTDLAGSMRLWIQNEEGPLRAARGAFTEENGHLYQILNPRNISFGYGEAQGGPYGIVGDLTLSEYNGDIDYPDGKIGYGSPQVYRRPAAVANNTNKAKDDKDKKDEKDKKKLKDNKSSKKKVFEKDKHLANKVNSQVANSKDSAKNTEKTGISGIVVAVIAIVIILCAVAVFSVLLYKSRKNARAKAASVDAASADEAVADAAVDSAPAVAEEAVSEGSSSVEE